MKEEIKAEDVDGQIKAEKLKRHYPDIQIKSEVYSEVLIRNSDGNLFLSPNDIIDEYREKGYL